MLVLWLIILLSCSDPRERGRGGVDEMDLPNANNLLPLPPPLFRADEGCREGVLDLIGLAGGLEKSGIGFALNLFTTGSS